MLLAVGITCFGAVLYFLRDVLAPFAMALFIKILLDPIIDYLEKKRFPRFAAIGATFTVAALLLVLIIGIVASSLSQLLNHADAYEARFLELVWDLVYSIPDGVGKRLDLGELVGLAVTGVKSFMSLLTSSIVGLMGESFVTGLFVVFFLLADKSQRPISRLQLNVEKKIRGYMTVKVGLSALTAVLTGSLLSLAQVDLALVFALLAFLLNFIPNIGSILAVLFPLPVLILSPKLTLTSSLGVFACLVVIQFIIGNLVEPKLIGDTLELNPVLVLFSLLLWGAVWGISGAILAVPLTAALKLLMEKPSSEDLEVLPRSTMILEER